MNNTKQFFDAKYVTDPDPWRFATSEYERARYDAIFAAIEFKRYEQIYEPGCSIGILTQKIAAIANQVQAIDISPRATQLAHELCKDYKNVSITCDSVLNAIPHKDTDLIIFSELGYYFSATELQNLILRLSSFCVRTHYFLAAHWLGTSEDHQLSGDEVHSIIAQQKNFHIEYSARFQFFRLDRWRIEV